MDWKLKAFIQNAISTLPSTASYASYYWLQRRFGGLKNLSPISRLSAGISICDRILNQGLSPRDKVFFEVGTGHIPLVPLAFWLMGAKKTVTFDLNPYLKTELVDECLTYIRQNTEEIVSMFGERLILERLNKLLLLGKNQPFSLRTFLETCRIVYSAPGDAAATQLDSGAIDFHTSYNVLEHIPPAVLTKILNEASRITKPRGLLVHKIDYSDHFSHSDPNISAINFLQFSQDVWKRLAGNKYMYMNRLRHDDFIGLFNAAGQTILEENVSEDTRSRQLLESSSLELHRDFSEKSLEVLSIHAAWITSRHDQADFR